MNRLGLTNLKTVFAQGPTWTTYGKSLNNQIETVLNSSAKRKGVFGSLLRSYGNHSNQLSWLPQPNLHENGSSAFQKIFRRLFSSKPTKPGFEAFKVKSGGKAEGKGEGASGGDGDKSSGNFPFKLLAINMMAFFYDWSLFFDHELGHCAPN
mmetsp:Transcript_27322/g.50372  ORF Transcript_27322/g.50372 Transcript_27322/m.50372 type:complete len:152 (-) Transcript_27322:2327-2782(-)